jgi:hypothetical protein
MARLEGRVVGNADAIHGWGDHVHGEHVLEAEGRGLPRELAHWMLAAVLTKNEVATERHGERRGLRLARAVG